MIKGALHHKFWKLCQIFKASLKRFVLGEDLNCWTVFDFLNEMGEAFYNVGAATVKDLSPKDVNIFSWGKSSHKPSFNRSW